jgi:hypothetical protein
VANNKKAVVGSISLRHRRRLHSVVKQQQAQEDRTTEREGHQNNIGLEQEIEHRFSPRLTG